MIEVLRGVRAFPQPSPARNEGGDCFACASTAVLGALFPERPPTFDQVFEWFREKYANSEREYISSTWQGMQAALWKARTAGYPIDVTTDAVEPRIDPQRWGYAWLPGEDETRYARRLEGWLRSGWLALVTIDYDGKGHQDEEGRVRSGNHFVVLDGTREGWEPGGIEGAWSSTSSLHVVCSARGAYWIRALTFLRKHGGAAMLLVRRDER